ncbi:MAG: hypothetical protein IJN65_00490 [Clostridia bacterium]|nr:hypothetical protein [Clostridia bacterium]
MIEKELGSLPSGFAVALAKNEKALMRFSEMTDAQRRSVIDGINTLHSKEELVEYINKITTI